MLWVGCPEAVRAKAGASCGKRTRSSRLLQARHCDPRPRQTTRGLRTSHDTGAAGRVRASALAEERCVMSRTSALLVCEGIDSCYCQSCMAVSASFAFQQFSPGILANSLLSSTLHADGHAAHSEKCFDPPNCASLLPLQTF